MTTHATALFADRHSAHAAVEQLVQAGFPRDAISVLMSESTHEREFGAPSSERTDLGGRSAGVLGSIVTGLVVLPSERGSLRAAGPLVTALMRAPGGAEATDARLPAVLEAAGFASAQAQFVDEGVRGGGIAVAVYASGERTRLAVQLLELAGGALRAA